MQRIFLASSPVDRFVLARFVSALAPIDPFLVVQFFPALTPPDHSALVLWCDCQCTTRSLSYGAILLCSSFHRPVLSLASKFGSLISSRENLTCLISFVRPVGVYRSTIILLPCKGIPPWNPQCRKSDSLFIQTLNLR